MLLDAGLQAEEAATDNIAILGTKGLGETLHKGVVGRTLRHILRVAGWRYSPRQQRHATHRATHLTQTTHATAKGCGKARRMQLIETHNIVEGHDHSLCAVVAREEVASRTLHALLNIYLHSFHFISYLCPSKDIYFFAMAQHNYPTLSFPPIRLRARRTTEGRTEVFDRVRGRWLVLTPEEWVRRHVVEYLVSCCNALPQQIVEEYPVAINGMAQRADIVVLGEDARPRIVVECKEPNIELGEEVLAQVVRYNSILGAEYVVITNGLVTRAYRHEGGRYCIAEHFPRL